jgi:vacuole morphology and inheritance protein 14
MEDEGSPLPPAILRGLGDRSYDKRKAAALEVTGLIKACQENGEKDRISSVINLLAQEFTRSRNVNHRKGGLIALAASAIGLAPEIDLFLNLLIPPVLECFDDQEPRVCYYACESLYNISKVARTSILRYFNQIFDGLCKLFAHVDVDVKNGANLLDRLIKDIVTETETFDIEAFIPLLQKHIKRTKPYIRQLLVGWIIVLDAVPDINMLDCTLCVACCSWW